MSTRALPLALAALAGVAAWLSMGVLAVVDATTVARVGVLPPWWVLCLSVALFSSVVALRGLSSSGALPLALTGLVCLPWLPGRIPAAFLVWYGPPARLVWALVAIGLAAPQLARMGRARWFTTPALAPWLSAMLVTAAFGVGAVALQERMPAGDEPHYLVITQSLLLDHDLRIENNHARHDYETYYQGELRPDFLRRGLDGQIYSIHAPGISAALAPAFALAGYPGAVLAMVVLSALGLALLWTTAWKLTGSAGAAWMAWAMVAFSAPGYFHAFAIYPDGAGAVCTTLPLWALVRLERGEGLGTRHLVGVGAALAALPWLHTRFAIVAGVLGAVLALRLLSSRNPVRAVAVVVVLPVMSGLAWLGYFWVIWGRPDPSAPYGFITQTSLVNLRAGIPGLLIDQQFGLISNAPIYALALIGMAALARRHWRLSLELTTLAAIYAATVASYPMWWGGYSAPARFLVVILPALALPLATLWSRYGAGVRAMALVLLVAGVAITLARVVVDHGGLLYNARDGFDLLLDWANRSVSLPLALPSVHRGAVGEALRDAGVWAVTGVVLGVVPAWIARGGPDRAWVLASAWLALTVMAASSLVWSRHADGLTSSTSALDLLHQWPEQWQGTGWRSRPFGLLPVDQVPAQLALESSDRGPRAEGEPSLFSAPYVPAGDYEIAVEGNPRPAGTLAVSVGRTTHVVDVADLAGREGGLTGLVIDLPVRVHSLTIRGDDEARQSVSRLTLRPRSVFEPGRRAEGLALRAVRYGAARVFFLDDTTFTESRGFWTRGASVTELIVDTRQPDGHQDAAPLALAVRAGAVPTTARISVGGWSEQVRLAPRGEALVTLPPRADAPAWRLHIESGPGFRPVQHEPENRDQRNLGVWLEFK